MMGCVTVTVDVDVDLSEIDTENLIDELDYRGEGYMGTDEESTLTKIWIHDREGRKEQAYALMREYVLQKLNKVV
jgi:hypothetical protein